MTEGAYEKQITELGKEMDKELLMIDDASIPSLGQFVWDAIRLRAELQDINASKAGVVPNCVDVAQQIHSSQKARDEYARGREQLLSVNPDEIKEDLVQDIARTLTGCPPYDTVCYPPLIHAVTGSSPPERQAFISLKQDLERADVHDHIIAFIVGERMRACAQKLLHEYLRQLLMKTLSLPIDYDHPEMFWRLQLAGVDKKGEKVRDGIEFLHGFVGRMDTITNESARLLYGEQAPRALALWRSILSTEGRRAPHLKDFRQRCAAALIAHLFDAAEDILAEAYAENPFSFSRETREYIKEHIPLPEKQQQQPPTPTPSELQKRFAEQLDYFRPLIGKIFRTQGGRMVEITDLGEKIRYTSRGWRPGITITPLRKNKLTGNYIKTVPITLLPSILLAKMEEEQWTETYLTKE